MGRVFLKCFAIITLSIVFVGCNIKTYRVSSGDTQFETPSFSSQKDTVIYFNVPQYFEEREAVLRRQEPLLRADSFVKLLESSLIDNPSFSKAVLTSRPPEKGLYVSIAVRGENEFSFSSVLSILLSACTLTVIPVVNDDIAQYVISYQLYRNGESVQLYQHRVQQKTLIWIGTLLAVPFIYDSWFTAPWGTPKEKLFAETAKLFWIDGHREGHF